MSDHDIVLAHALKLGLRYFERLLRDGLVPPEVRATGLLPPEIQAMHGALQQHESALGEAREAVVVPATAVRIEEPQP